ncbi:MAG: hypothetical protein JWN01_228 [Patescibacteria group bacterium]|nr:hypothetical protein [Patescibacteria group bacterium]
MPNDAPSPTGPTRRRPPRWAYISAGGLLLTLLLAGGGIAAWRSTHSLATVPANVAERTLFPIYRLTYVPAGFTLDQNSYAVQDGALIFQAITPAGENIAVTETALPPKFDFTSFYDKNFQDAKNLQSKTPYTAILGTLKSNGRRAVSIETTTTWIIITSRHRFSESEAIQLAKGLRRQ